VTVQAVLDAVFEGNSKSFTLRQLEYRTGLAYSTIRCSIHDLEKHGIIQKLDIDEASNTCFYEMRDKTRAVMLTKMNRSYPTTTALFIALEDIIKINGGKTP
jgi:DNA-binding transcriptional regulator PaaX